MKNLGSIIVLSVFILASCEKDETMVKTKENAVSANITSHTSGFTKVITEANLTETVEFEWSPADYGVNTPVNYALEVALSGDDFSNAQVLAETLQDTVVLTWGAINTFLINNLEVTANEPVTVQLRITSSLLGKGEVTSEIITATITPFELIIIVPETPAMLYLVGEFQDWEHTDAAIFRKTGTGLYEGYVNVTTATKFLFTTEADFEHVNYGYSGADGGLTTEDEADSLQINTPGYYKFMVDLTDPEDPTYSTALITTWGMVGPATAGGNDAGWNTSIPMSYDEETKLWTGTINLAASALKFRANDNWDINFGPANSNQLVGTLIQTNDAVTIPEAANYTVTIDLTKSVEPYVYKYTLVKN